jgi:hypothetical protein
MHSSSPRASITQQDAKTIKVSTFYFQKYILTQFEEQRKHVEWYFEPTAANNADISRLKLLRSLHSPLLLPEYVCGACVCLYICYVGNQVRLCVYSHIVDWIRKAESQIETGLFEPMCFERIVSFETMTLIQRPRIPGLLHTWKELSLKCNTNCVWRSPRLFFRWYISFLYFTLRTTVPILSFSEFRSSS